MTSNIKNPQLKFLIGIPVLLLLLSLFLPNNKAFDSDKNINPYLADMPNLYVEVLSKAKENDSTFFCSVIDDFALRELVIFKATPTSKDLKTDFVIEIYPSEIKHLKGYEEFLTINLVRDAATFNNDGKTYCMFKTSLPMINIDKLLIKKKWDNAKNEPWENIIEKPFKLLDKVVGFQETNKTSELFKPNPYSLLFKETLSNNDIEVLPAFYKKRNDSLVSIIENIDVFINSNNKTIGKINEPELFWKRVNSNDKPLEKQIKFEGTDADKAKQLLNDYINKKSTLEEVFNIQKLALFNALTNVFSNTCAEEAYFIYNSTDNLLEPFYVNSNCLGVEQKFVKKSNIENNNYLEAFVNALNEVSNLNFYDMLIKDNTSFKNELALINGYDTNTVFNYDIIKVNQNIIKKSLNSSSALKVELISIDTKKMVVIASNVSNYPIEVLGLNHLDKKEIVKINPIVEILSNQKDTITINIPQSFKNLFVSKKKKVTGFVLPKHIYDLSIKYKISGLDISRTTPIIPYQYSKSQGEDLFRSKRAINNHQDLVVNQETKEIYFSKPSVKISEALVIPKGYVFKLNAGDNIDLINGGKIISHSPLSFIGTNEKPIKIHSSDKNGQGLLILSEGEQSNLKHVTFDYLSNPSHGSWGVTGAVTFYESPVNLENVKVSNNSCEDALNIVRTNFVMKSSEISNTQSDAFDGDFVKGTIIDCKFVNLGNDAIDVSGADLIIRNVVVTKAGDKGLSAGENSKMAVNNVEIYDSEIAVAGKDLSIIEAKKLKITNTKLAFTAFQKKPEFGPSNITVNDIQMVNVETQYLIENTSSLFVDGEKIESSQNVKDRMYGVEFGISSEETRNKKQ